MSFDWFNSKHYKDETAKKALDSVEQHEAKRKKVAHYVEKKDSNNRGTRIRGSNR